MMEDLTGLLAGEIRCDALAVQMYASDASLYQIPPLGVAYPQNREDVVTLAKYSAEMGIPLIPRGAGSGLAGSALGSGLIVDFSRSMRRVESINEETIRVQPGIVRDRLNHLLRPYGRYFPPDPSNTSVTTVGGMLGVDAAGSHAVRVGSMRDHVESLEVVLAGGQVVEAGVEPLQMLRTPPPQRSAIRPGLETGQDDGETAFAVKRNLVSRLSRLLSDNEQVIRERQPALIRNSCGYMLRGVLSETHLNLPRLLVGSEGTLGLWTAATLHTAPLPAYRGVVLLLFGQLEGAIRSVQQIARQQPSACDLMDRRLLTLAREADSRFQELISPAAEAALLVEQLGSSEKQVRDRLRMVVATVREVNLRAVVAQEAYTPEAVDFLWSLPTKVVPLLTKLKGPSRPLPIVEDIAVPPEAMHEFLVSSQKVFQKHQVTASLYAHAASGQLHMRPFLPPPSQPLDGTRLESLARDLYQAVRSVGGTISGEHGDGLARTSFIRSQYGPLYRVFQQVKDIFDPHNLLNPGKIISDDAHITAKNFRPPAVASPEFVELQLNWTPDEMAEEAGRCNGCGVCRTQSPDLRMCPFFRIDPVEDASPRSKANVVRGVLTGAMPPDEFASDEMKRLASLCFNCKQCQLECPTNVNIPQLMIEAKAAYVSANGLSRADWILSRAHSLGAVGSTMAFVANWMIRHPTARWVMDKLLGISRHRKLPLFARRSFLRSLRSESTSGSGAGGNKPVVYFVGDYANYYDPELSQALVAILRHHDIPVIVPRGQTSSGMSMISAGDLDAAREVAQTNLRVLGDYAREGIPILCTEPSAALCLKQEYPMLLNHPDVQMVADQTIEAGLFLENLHREGRLKRDFASLALDAGYHTPCHLKALSGSSSLARLLALIPDLRLSTIDNGCSGMAGAYGLTSENYQTSIKLGWGLISRMRDGDLTIGTTECASCKIQMEQGTTIPTLHPLKLLAYSYGLMPQIANKLQRTTGKLTIS